MSQFLNLFEHERSFKNVTPQSFLQKQCSPEQTWRKTDPAQQSYFTGEETEARTQGHGGGPEARTLVRPKVKTTLIGIHREGENVSYKDHAD